MDRFNLDVLRDAELLINILRKFIAILMDDIEFVKDFKCSRSFDRLLLLDEDLKLLRLKHFNTYQIRCFLGRNKESAFLLRNSKYHIVTL